MKTTLKKGDIIVSNGFTLNDKFTPFRKVRAVIDKKFILIDNVRQKTTSKDFRLATDTDYITDTVIRNSIKIVNRTDDKNQHVSSVTGEEKKGYYTDTKAYVTAYKMCYNYGGEWVIYKCNVCELFHIGKEFEK